MSGRRDGNSYYSEARKASGVYRATVITVSDNSVSIEIPRLYPGIALDNVTYIGDVPSSGDTVYAFMVEGNQSNFIAFAAVKGHYGPVQTTGPEASTYEGYSINDQFVFMGDSSECGIYNNVDDQWMLLMEVNAHTRLYDSDDAVAFGAENATTSGGASSGDGYVGISNECGGFSGTTAVMSSSTVAGVTMKRLGFSSSSYEYKTGIEDLIISDEAFMSLRPITYHPNGQYVDSTGEVTEIVGGHTIIPDNEEAGETSGLIPLRRAGFGLEDLYLREDTMILASEFAPDSNALIAALTLKLQETMNRVTELEAAL